MYRRILLVLKQSLWPSSSVPRASDSGRADDGQTNSVVLTHLSGRRAPFREPVTVDGLTTDRQILLILNT